MTEQVSKFLESTVQFCSADPLGVVVGSAVVLAMSSRMHFTRYFRGTFHIASVMFLLWRFLSSSETSESILEFFMRALPINSIRVVAGDAVGLFLLSEVFSFSGRALALNYRAISSYVKDKLFSLVKDFSFVKNELDKERKNLDVTLKKELKSKVEAMGPIPILKTLPEVGMETKEILSFMQTQVGKEDGIWLDGKVSGSVYHGIKGHQDALNKAFSLYSLSNPLHPEVWPSLMKYDSEIIAMTASLVNGGVSSVCGCTSSGGTESIILAMKAHRDYYRETAGITAPEMVACISAHAAVDKGCNLMGITLIKVPMDQNTFEVDLVAMERAIGPNTIMLYASAPGYPQGVIDPVREMSRLALKYGIGLHVDCCLGGFVLPFAKKLGYDIPDFDFGLPGVTSMSLDTHKYGYALKGSSVVLYRTKELRQSQYFSFPDWTGGIYTTPTIAGSRSGGIIAQTWASMVLLGVEGYKKHAEDILTTTRKITEGVRGIAGLRLLGKAQAMIVCFTGSLLNGREIDIYGIGDAMTRRGWSLNTLQSPASMHLCCTVRHVGHEEDFLTDLRDAVTEIAAQPVGKKKEGKAAIYGMASAMPGGSVNEILKVYNDVVLDA